MKEIRGIKRGVKLEAQPTKSERLATLDKELKNLQMAGRVTQMLVQQMMNNVQNMSKDLAKAFGIVSELQYKILAMQSVGNFDMDAMTKKAEELRLTDFIEASDAEDAAGNFTIGDKVQDDSTVIITSVSPGENTGIFRSRIKLADCGVPALIQGLAGQSVGAKVKCTLNSTEHEVELLAIRNPPPALAVVQDLPSGQNVPVGDIVTSVNEAGQVEETQRYVRVPEGTTVH